jgi:hypothetical protein
MSSESTHSARRLSTREDGKFATLPLYVRGLAAMLLKFCDDNGRIALGSRTPAAAVARRCRAEVGERRCLPGDIQKLIDVGYLRLEQDAIVVVEAMVDRGMCGSEKEMKNLRWDDEEHVKLYTRDTVEWLRLSLAARGLYCLLLRAVDSEGRMVFGDIALEDVGSAVCTMLRGGEASDVIELLRELERQKFVLVSKRERGELALVIPHFIDAQYAKVSARHRNQQFRARERNRGSK